MIRTEIMSMQNGSIPKHTDGKKPQKYKHVNGLSYDGENNNNNKNMSALPSQRITADLLRTETITRDAAVDITAGQHVDTRRLEVNDLEDAKHLLDEVKVLFLGDFTENIFAISEKLTQFCQKLDIIPSNNKDCIRKNVASEETVLDEIKKLKETNQKSLDRYGSLLEHLEDMYDLTKYLYQTPRDDWPDGLDVSHIHGPVNEVYTMLKSRDIDVGKDWASRLMRRAPTLRELALLSLQETERCCGGSNLRERDIVDQMIEQGESADRGSAFAVDVKLVEQNNQKKEEELEKLEAAKALLENAKTLEGSEDHDIEFDNRMTEVCNVIGRIPPDQWKHSTSRQRFLEQLEKDIILRTQVMETMPSYNSMVEVSAKASGGLALMGVYHSDYERARTSSNPILLPPSRVELFNPITNYDNDYVKFTEKGAAAKFIREVEMSGLSVGKSVAGFLGLLDGEQTSGLGRRNIPSAFIKKNTSVSVTNYILIGMKAFQIRRGEMKMRLRARKMALSIVYDDNKMHRKDAARRFFSRYGSHVPGGVHELGGIFFSTVDATTDKETNMKSLSDTALNRLNAKISIGEFGACFLDNEQQEDTCNIETDIHEQVDVNSCYSLKSIGPPANHPATFKELLSSKNSTWAILDRGDSSGYIPVWEMVQELGGMFRKSAEVMRKTWMEDEEERKRVSEEKKKAAEEHEQKKLQEKARRELESRREEEFGRLLEGELHGGPVVASVGHWPTTTGDQLVYRRPLMSKEEACSKAIDLVIDDPRHNICQINNSSGACFARFTLKCWKAKQPLTYGYGSAVDGHQLLYYSKEHFQWKDEVPYQHSG